MTRCTPFGWVQNSEIGNYWVGVGGFCGVGGFKGRFAKYKNGTRGEREARQ